MLKIIRFSPAVCLAFALSGCSTVGYHAQLARGESALLSARRGIPELLSSRNVAPQVKTRLRLAWQARLFASSHLDLPNNGSYTSYTDLHRVFAVWDVFATPEFSVRAVDNCFPVAGCVAYRGYFRRAGAEAEATRLRARGDDVAIFGVPTYSTLGWFSDPVLNTMLRLGTRELIGEIFHELAHQKIYVPGDTQFNESYADFVEREGFHQWQVSRGLKAGSDLPKIREDQFAKLMLQTRDFLRKLYRHHLPADMLRARKAAVFAQLRERYLKLRDGPWRGYAGYDGFFDRTLNNACLLPFGLYDQWVPGFAILYTRSGRSWPQFFSVVRKLSKESKARRDATLEQLTKISPSGAST